ncbi:MAG TPA: hypothetical protein VMY78_09980 [Solirubrobacteraceae bacterium]|nr:hypothetical protein [Solirubrobacteraceae bacterium]
MDDVLALQVGRVLSPGAGAPARVPPIADVGAGRVCAWCGGPIPAGARVDSEVCGVVCRKRRWRFRRAVPTSSSSTPGMRPASIAVGPMRFAYADPPYPGKAGYYVERQEVDHLTLVAELKAGYPDGWALSTSAAALRDVLAMCPASTRVCVWRRRTRPTTSKRALSAWEPLLVVGGRELATDVPQDLLDVLDYRGRYDAFPGALVGMKPPEFAVWLFRQLGARAGDELADVFPGSGAIGRAWALYTSRGDLGEDPRDASQLEQPCLRHASPEALRHASPAAAAKRDG